MSKKKKKTKKGGYKKTQIQRTTELILLVTAIMEFINILLELVEKLE